MNIIGNDFFLLGAIAFSGGRFPAGTGSIKLSNTICTGSETSLLNCSTRVDHTCTHAEDAGVRCIGKKIIKNVL